MLREIDNYENFMQSVKERCNLGLIIACSLALIGCLVGFVILLNQ